MSTSNGGNHRREGPRRFIDFKTGALMVIVIWLTLVLLDLLHKAV